MKKNTLIFLSVEGLGLNKEWKGNYFKLANKPNINHLISGIYPWALVSNEKKESKINVKKSFDSVSRDIHKNFYQMLYGQKAEIKTVNEKFKELVETKQLHTLKIFESLKDHSLKFNSKCVHMFFLLSDNKYHCDIDNIKFTANILIKRGLYPIFHVIADGKEDKQYGFYKHLENLTQYCLKRNIPIATISGRDNAFIKMGHSFNETNYIQDYFNTVCGLGDNEFSAPLDYAYNCMFDKTYDQHIKPAYNKSLSKYYVEKNDMILFMDSDHDNFSPLLKLLREETRLGELFIGSVSQIYGNKIDETFFEEVYDEKKEMLLTNIAAQNNLKSLVLSLNHKKGFISQFYGSEKNENVTKKAISTDFVTSDIDYIFAANKFLIDKTIKSIGEYDLIIVHIPTIAEAARTSDMKLLKFAIENFDKNLGRLINFAKFTGNIITFVSPYGCAEKMLNKKLNIIPYNKNSVVPFVFTNGYLSTKKMKSDFFGLYSTLLVTLGIENLSKSIEYKSLITRSYDKNVIHNRLVDDFDAWKEQYAKPLIDQFEENNLSLYNDLNKDPEYIDQKQKYIILKELIKIHEKVFTTPESREKVFIKLLEYVKYNNIDFIGFKYNYNKLFMTIFDDEIKLSKMTKTSNRFFDDMLWKTQIKRNNKWVHKIKEDLRPGISRKMPKSALKRAINVLEDVIEPYSYFNRLFDSEKEVLSTNDAYKIYEFYNNIRDDVKQVFDKYFLPKVADEQIDELEESNQQHSIDFRKVASYFQIFMSNLEIIDESRYKLDLYNAKYMETIQNSQFYYDDIFDAEPYQLNILTRKIVNNYRTWFRNVKQFENERARDGRKQISKYDFKYSKKYETALQGISYEGEFLEGVDLSKQEALKEKMSAKVKKDKFIDYPSIDELVINQEKKDYTEKEEEVILDDGSILVIPDISGNVRMGEEYDLTTEWNEKRKEEIEFNKTFREYVSFEAEGEVRQNRKVREIENKLDKYVELSSSWVKKEKATTN